MTETTPPTSTDILKQTLINVIQNDIQSNIRAIFELKVAYYFFLGMFCWQFAPLIITAMEKNLFIFICTLIGQGCALYIMSDAKKKINLKIEENLKYNHLLDINK